MSSESQHHWEGSSFCSSYKSLSRNKAEAAFGDLKSTSSDISAFSEVHWFTPSLLAVQHHTRASLHCKHTERKPAPTSNTHCPLRQREKTDETKAGTSLKAQFLSKETAKERVHLFNNTSQSFLPPSLPASIPLLTVIHFQWRTTRFEQLPAASSQISLWCLCEKSMLQHFSHVTVWFEALIFAG